MEMVIFNLRAKKVVFQHLEQGYDLKKKENRTCKCFISCEETMTASTLVKENLSWGLSYSFRGSSTIIMVGHCDVQADVVLEKGLEKDFQQELKQESLSLGVT